MKGVYLIMSAPLLMFVDNHTREFNRFSFRASGSIYVIICHKIYIFPLSKHELRSLEHRQLSFQYWLASNAHQAITWANADLLLVRLKRTYRDENVYGIQKFYSGKYIWKWLPFSLILHVCNFVRYPLLQVPNARLWNYERSHSMMSTNQCTWYERYVNTLSPSLHTRLLDAGF